MPGQDVVTFDYSFGGLRVRSDFALPGLVAVPRGQGGEPQLRITAEVGTPLVPDRVWYAWSQGNRMELGEHQGRWLIRSRFDGSFLIERDGGGLHLVAQALPPEPEVLEVLLRRILPRVPMLHGAIAIHAASLAYGGDAVMLIGRSGAGKSTLSASLSRHPGWQVLGDDTALMWTPAAPMLGAGARTVCLWPESRDGLGVGSERSELLANGSGKVRTFVDGGDLPSRLPLRAVVFLNRSADTAIPELRKLDLAEAIGLTVPQLIRFNPHGDSGRERVDAVLGVTEALRVCPAWSLNYPSTYPALQAVEVLLRTRLMDEQNDCVARQG
jgi:hypothetical protein